MRAVYELHNVASGPRVRPANDEAEQGKVSKEAFVAGILKYELLAAQRTRAFYVQVFLPWAEKQKLSTDPSLWFCDWWDLPQTALANFTDKSAYPWRPYGRGTHDWATVHLDWRCGQFDKGPQTLAADARGTGLRGGPGRTYRTGSGDVWPGSDKPAEAVAAFGEAIRLDPDNAAAYRARGEQYQKLGEKAKAAADAAKAKELETDKQ